MSQHVISIREIIAIALTMGKRTDFVDRPAPVDGLNTNGCDPETISQGNFKILITMFQILLKKKCFMPEESRLVSQLNCPCHPLCNDCNWRSIIFSACLSRKMSSTLNYYYIST